MDKLWYTGLVDFDGHRLEKRGYWVNSRREPVLRTDERRFYPKAFDQKMQIDFRNMHQRIELHTGLPGPIQFEKLILSWFGWAIYLVDDENSKTLWRSQFVHGFYPFRDNPFGSPTDEMIFYSLIPEDVARKGNAR
jgi:hypothetical protein